MIEVLRVNGDGTGVVDLKGLVRIVLNPSGRVVRELCEPRYADAFISSFNSGDSDSWAEAIGYADVFQRASSA